MNKTISKIFARSFGLRVWKAVNNIFDIDQHISIKAIKADQFIFKINPVSAVADPFLFVNDDILYLFYEEKINYYGKGVIKLTTTKNLRDWSVPQTVLKENFHLSFPFIFKMGNDLFMIPESGEDKSIRIYKPNDDLTEWTFYKKILSGHNYKDSSIYIKNNILYLFTTINQERTLTLRLYYSEDLDNNWVEHPCSPICTGDDIARNGGSVFHYRNELYRPVQNCRDLYGGNLSVFKIKELSKTVYHEEVMKEDIFPRHIPFYFLGGHHFNYIEFQNEMIVASDGLQYDFNAFNLIQRLYNALKLFVELKSTPITTYNF